MGRVVGLGMEILNQSNYRLWKSCMESYLVSEDLWDVVGGSSTTPPMGAAATAEATKEWTRKNAKAEFALKRSISSGVFEHVSRCTSASSIWQALDQLFNKKNEARLQLLENELANAKQGESSISEFFIKVKNLCSEINTLNPEESISEARLKRSIIRGLRPEYTPFVTSVQGWATQPSLEEFENLLASQESLATQMAGVKIHDDSGSAFVARRQQSYKGKTKNDGVKNNDGRERSSTGDKKQFKCYRCGKLGHFKKDCRVKLKETNMAESKSHTEDEDWGKCFTVEAASSGTSTTKNLGNDWIVDSGCSHHITGNEKLFSSLQRHDGKEAIITADNSIHRVEKEGTIVIEGEEGGPITLKNVYHVPGVKKNLLSVVNAVDSGNYVLFGPKDVKFLKNIQELKADVVHTGARVKDLYVLSASNSYIEKMSTNDNAFIWHARLGHINMTKLKAMVNKDLVNGLPKLKIQDEGKLCEGCQYGKSHRLPFDNSTSRCNAPLERIHSDLMGPTRTSSYSGFRYMLLFVDDYSRYTWVYFVKEKSEVFSKFQEFKVTVEGELGRKIKTLRTDNGGEFMSNEFLSFCRKHGIKREFSCPYTPQQNGVAERKIRHLSETCRSWLHAKNLPKALWAEGMRCAAYVINRMPLSPNNMKSPYEMVHGKKPTVKHLRIFGSICYVHVFDSQRTKLEAKAKKCIFVGYDEQRKGWRCMDPETHRYTVSRDVVFDEVSSYYGSPQVLVEQDGAGSLKDDEPAAQIPSDGGISEPEMQGERGSTNQEEEEEEDHGSLANQRPKRDIVKPARYRDERFVTTYSCYFASPFDEEEPSSYDEAKGVKEWETAMKEEMDALKKNETWDLVPKPKDVQPVSCKWVYRIKRKRDGNIDRHKARLVARGFSQKYGEDYDETFSPVAKMTTVRTLLSLAASFGWKLWQLDVKNAFLYGELDKEIYMEQPLGYISQEHPDYVCKLKKALYGLKQAPRAWYGKLAQFLQFCGYSPSNSDPSLFFKKNGGVHVVVLLYVDDLIITGNDEAEIARLQEDMSIRFEMKMLGELNNFLGLEVERMKDGIFIGQHSYARRIVEKFGVHEGKTRTTPMDANIKLKRDEGSLLPDPRPYRSLVGSLLYLTITRPDISFAVGLVSRFMQSPRKPHLEAAKKILKYVKTTLGMGLMYKYNAKVSLYGFTDADFGGDLDGRKSTSGFVFLCGDTSVSWCSKKQATVSLSTTEAEYKASTLAAQECIWLRRLLEDLFEPINKPVAIYGDNQSAIKLANNPVFHARTKHIELEHHFIREKVLDGTIEALEVRSEDNVADIFTKSLPKGQFELLRSKLGMVDKIKFKGEY
ncbi:unnamed protein product [Microthlaspi erraticum]|nr:unnamed protein product [Microthlaspi erraticum]CAA7020375.1 unnamed protein product [Microthlaspi erraticum]CAA7031052.1 unnamed protein product [Microthlaspi erraticum]CAA7036404.1 unnamed protein product [Microthlaspi erraticum]CAA7036776.1 unnamed protein product [Microthlaspi erraticum]